VAVLLELLAFTSLWVAAGANALCAAAGRALGAEPARPRARHHRARGRRAARRAPIPLATLAALAAFRPTELYGFIAVDGALLVGALISLARL